MPEYIPLAFGVESLYPPTQLQTNALRELYNRLAEPCRFTEFRQLGEGQGARLAEGANRHLTITSDRIIYRDDFTQTLFSSFTEDVTRILRHARETMRLSVLLHSKILVRLLMPHSGEGSAVEFFQKRLLNIASLTPETFGRPLSGAGLRLVFPPTKEHHSTFHLRLEPYYRDAKMFFLENSAQFFDPLVNFDDIQKYLDSVYDFTRDRGGPFLLDMQSPL